MVLPLYLAMTAQEMASAYPLPPHFAYMACHFSPGGRGLTNLPRNSMPEQMLILDDRYPFQDHSISLIAGQLEEILAGGNFESLLLDFQRQNESEVIRLVRLLEDTLPCPVAVSQLYGKHSRGPVFLPPVPPDVPVEEYVSPWQGREIWLEAALDTLCLTVSSQGCTEEYLRSDLWDDPGLPCPRLHCHCRMALREDSVCFSLTRTEEDFRMLLEDARQLGIRRAVGLWQEFG